MQHDERCLAQQASVQRAQNDYDAAWPAYCAECNGWGGYYSQYDPSPSGVSLSSGSITDFTPCESCLGNGICPRCGQMGWAGEEAGEKPCVSCRWIEGEAGRPIWDGMCVCEEIKLREAEKAGLEFWISRGLVEEDIARILDGLDGEPLD